MSNGGQSNPRFRRHPRENQDLRSLGCAPWQCYAATTLQLRGSRPRAKDSTRLPFRLDTGAFLSLLPEKWLTGPERLRRYVRVHSSGSLEFRTATGKGKGWLACDVPVLFTDAPDQTYPFDFLVTANLNDRNYGLISLRDLARHFTFETEGLFRLGPAEVPVELPDLVLIPRTSPPRVRYWCPQCRAEAWGRAGLNLGCNDCASQRVRA